MDLQTLSTLDDLLSDVLLDGVHLWFQTHKMNKDYLPLNLSQDVILPIIQKRVVIDRRVPEAVADLLEIEEIAKRLTSKKLVANFPIQARRYLNIYLPTAGFEISQTDRYTSLTKKSEACVIATRAFEPGSELRFCAGSMAHLTLQQEKDLEKKTSDFSVIKTSRRGTCLFLGPARFVNHDCDPNCNFMSGGADVIYFRALRSIGVNDEITTYYGDNYFGIGNQECLCATCERLGQGRYRSHNEAVLPLELTLSSEQDLIDALSLRPRTRATTNRAQNAFYQTMAKAVPAKKPTTPPNAAPVASDTIAHPTPIKHIQQPRFCQRDEISSSLDTELQRDDVSKSWPHLEPQHHELNYDSISQPCPASIDESSESLSDPSVLMDSTTDSSASELSTPSYMDSNSDVDIETVTPTYKPSRMSINFLCNSSSSTPSPGPYSSRMFVSVSPQPSPPADEEIERQDDRLSSPSTYIIDVESEDTPELDSSSTDASDTPTAIRKCTTCKNEMRKQEQALDMNCDRCIRHVNIYGSKWPSRNANILKATIKEAERANRPPKVTARKVPSRPKPRSSRARSGHSLASNTRTLAGKFTKVISKKAAKTTKAVKEAYTSKTTKKQGTKGDPPSMTADDPTQPSSCSKLIQPHMELDRTYRSRAMKVANTLSYVQAKPQASVDAEQSSVKPTARMQLVTSRKTTVHFPRHHVHMRTTDIPRAVTSLGEGYPSKNNMPPVFREHKIVVENMCTRYLAVMNLLSSQYEDRASVVRAYDLASDAGTASVSKDIISSSYDIANDNPASSAKAIDSIREMKQVTFINQTEPKRKKRAYKKGKSVSAEDEATCIPPTQSLGTEGTQEAPPVLPNIESQPPSLQTSEQSVPDVPVRGLQSSTIPCMDPQHGRLLDEASPMPTLDEVENSSIFCASRPSTLSHHSNAKRCLSETEQLMQWTIKNSFPMEERRASSKKRGRPEELQPSCISAPAPMKRSRFEAHGPDPANCLRALTTPDATTKEPSPVESGKARKTKTKASVSMEQPLDTTESKKPKTTKKKASASAPAEQPLIPIESEKPNKTKTKTSTSLEQVLSPLESEMSENEIGAPVSLEQPLMPLESEKPKKTKKKMSASVEQVLNSVESEKPKKTKKKTSAKTTASMEQVLSPVDSEIYQNEIGALVSVEEPLNPVESEKPKKTKKKASVSVEQPPNTTESVKPKKTKKKSASVEQVLNPIEPEISDRSTNTPVSMEQPLIPVAPEKPKKTKKKASVSVAQVLSPVESENVEKATNEASVSVGQPPTTMELKKPKKTKKKASAVVDVSPSAVQSEKLIHTTSEAAALAERPPTTIALDKSKGKKKKALVAVDGSSSAAESEKLVHTTNIVSTSAEHLPTSVAPEKPKRKKNKASAAVKGSPNAVESEMSSYMTDTASVPVEQPPSPVAPEKPKRARKKAPAAVEGSTSAVDSEKLNTNITNVASVQVEQPPSPMVPKKPKRTRKKAPVAVEESASAVETETLDSTTKVVSAPVEQPPSLAESDKVKKKSKVSVERPRKRKVSEISPTTDELQGQDGGQSGKRDSRVLDLQSPPCPKKKKLSELAVLAQWTFKNQQPAHARRTMPRASA
ncbi:Histone-lysine N-methyltransferase set9 [Podila humilis]|nr:Histone-lysine N-methyltransferase set9 [Podila humilis]